ncbi:hypothetical protein Tco_0080469 [Tanacetum coccineum]
MITSLVQLWDRVAGVVVGVKKFLICYQGGTKMDILENQPFTKSVKTAIALYQQDDGLTCLASSLHACPRVGKNDRNCASHRRRRTDTQALKRRHHDLRSDDVSILVTSSEHGRPKGTLEDSVSQD